MTARKHLDAIWTRLVIDPVADRLGPPLTRLSWVTPNRLTWLAGILAVAAAVAFGTGWLVLGGLLFQVRFLVDCLDGRVARLRGSTSAWGAALDVFVDTAGVMVCLAALAWHAAASGTGGPALLAAVVGGYGLYSWTLAYRKSLPGGGPKDWTAEPPERASGVVGRYVAAMARRGMVPTPYAVEVEAVCLTLLPLTVLVVPNAADRIVAVGLWGAAAFFIVASVLNVVRIRRLTLPAAATEPDTGRPLVAGTEGDTR